MGYHGNRSFILKCGEDEIYELVFSDRIETFKANLMKGGEKEFSGLRIKKKGDGKEQV